MPKLQQRKIYIAGYSHVFLQHFYLKLKRFLISTFLLAEKKHFCWQTFVKDLLHPHTTFEIFPSPFRFTPLERHLPQSV